MTAASVHDRRIIVRDIASLMGSNAVVRVGSLVLFVLLTGATRSLTSADYTVTFTVLSVSQILVALDLGVGSLVVDLVARGGAPEKVLARVGPLRRRLRAALLLCLPAVGVVEYLVLRQHGGARPAASFHLRLVALIALQLVLVAGTVVLGPYERALFGARSGMRLSRASSVGVVVSMALIAVAGLVRPSLVPLVVVLAVLGGTLISRVLNRRDVQGLGNGARTVDPAPERIGRPERSRAQLFWWLQVCGFAAFGIDQLVVSGLRSSAETASYSAHARYFQFGAAGLAVLINSLWPPIAAALERRDSTGARRTYTIAALVIVCVSGLWCAPVLVGLVPVSLFRSGERTDMALLVPMAVWFVMVQVGILLGQVQAALRDLSFQLRVGIVMAVVNVVVSVVLCRRVGAAGVVWGSVVSYPLIVLVPVLLRLRAPRLWRTVPVPLGEHSTDSFLHEATT